MNRVILDKALRAKLTTLDDELELCDESGRTLGYFMPADLHHRLWYEWARTQFTDEELERASQESGGYTNAELRDRLKAG